MLISVIWIVALVFLVRPTFAQSPWVDPDSIPFAPPVHYQVGHGPYGVWCANLFNEGLVDVAVACSDQRVVIRKNSPISPGTFPVRIDLLTGSDSSCPFGVCCGDFDKDGYVDVVTTDNCNDRGYFWLCIDGEFEEIPHRYYVKDGPLQVLCADLNDDGLEDLAVSRHYVEGHPDSVALLFNTGDENCFDTLATYSYPAGNGAFHVFCADLNSDGYWDMVVTNHYDSSLSILFNNGEGSFQLDSNYQMGAQTNFVFCADLDGDFNLDLAVTTEQDQNVSILFNNGDGTFQFDSSYTLEGIPNSVFCADLDGDGDLDLAATSSVTSNCVAILQNNGDGTFQNPDYYCGFWTPWSVFAFDCNGDGDLDLAVSNNQDDNGVFYLSILENLTQSNGNSPPYPFPLISPDSGQLVCDITTGETSDSVAHLNWATAYDPNLADVVKYDLYISTSITFPPGPQTIIRSNLEVSQHPETLAVDYYFWKVKAKDNWGAEGWSYETWSFTVQCGDVNNDCNIDLGDVLGIINYLYKDGPAPEPLERADVDENDIVDLGDLLYLINYLYKGGPPPCLPPQ